MMGLFLDHSAEACVCCVNPTQKPGGTKLQMLSAIYVAAATSFTSLTMQQVVSPGGVAMSLSGLRV
jgi:hypothetical protein